MPTFIRKQSIRLASVVLGVFVVVLYPINLTYAATSTFSPSFVTIGIGQTASVNVIATNGSDSNAADVVVSYDANVITPVSINAGPGVSALGGGTLSPNFTITVFKSGSNFTNGEVLAVLTFQGKAAGTTLLDSTGTDIQPGGNSGPQTATVTVSSSILPDTGIFDDPVQLAVIGMGSAVLIFGVYLGLKARAGRKQSASDLVE